MARERGRGREFSLSVAALWSIARRNVARVAVRTLLVGGSGAFPLQATARVVPGGALLPGILPPGLRSRPPGDMAQVDDFRSAPRHLSGSVSREARVPRKALPAAHGANVPQHRSGQNWQRFVAGGISGVAEVLVSHPLDLGEPWLRCAQPSSCRAAGA